MRSRKGKCEWVMYTDRFPRLRRRMPKPIRHKFWRSWLNWKTIRCDNPATDIAKCEFFPGYDNLPVCKEHLRDVEVSIKLDKMIKSGKLDRLLAEAKQRQEGKVPPE